MRFFRLRWTLAGAVLAALGLAAVALGGSGIGGVFNLGQTNTVDATSYLRGTASNAMLDVQNNGTGANSNGIVGRTASTSAPALAGVATGSGIGAKGVSASGPGLYGQSTSGIGVRAVAGGSVAALKATNTSTGPAGTFEVTGAAAPFTVNSGTKVTNLNADRLDDYHAADLVNVAGIQSFTVSITAPKNGFVLVNGSVHTWSSSPVCVPCTITMHYQRDSDGTAISPDTYGSVWEQDIKTSDFYANVAASWVFPVTAGAHTFSMVFNFPALPPGSSITLTVDGLTALFVPFGTAGPGPTGAAAKPGDTTITHKG